MKSTFHAAAPLPVEEPRVRKARAFIRPGRLLLVALMLLGAYSGFVVFLIGLAGLIALGTAAPGVLALSGLAAFGLGKLAAFGLSRSLSCSLCHGPVMQERRCQKHAQALRLPLLSHRASAVASVLTTGTFRCMYCGTAYRLRK